MQTPTTTSPGATATLIILAWNQWPLTRRCLETLFTTDLSGAQVLVVDNGSTDETPERLAEIAADGRIRSLRLPENSGFVRGNNAGIEAADPESDIVLLNNDLIFEQADWLERMRACAAAAPDVGVVGCRHVLPDGRLLHAGTYILPDTMWGQQIGALEEDLGQFQRDRTVQGVAFACVYVKRALVRRIGALSTDFESYFEDTDYCLRAADAGFRTTVCGAVTVTHDEHGSTSAATGDRLRLFRRSQAVFRRRWAGPLERRYRHRLLWQSILNFPTGYAQSSRALLSALDDAGVRCAYRYVYGPGTVFPLVEPEDTHDYRLNVVRDRGRETARAPIGVVYGQADAFRRNRGRYKVGFTMLEVDGFPADWVEQANRMDEVWVPSAFNRQGFLDSGLERPVHVVPLGVDTDRFHPGIRTVRNPDGDFVFLASFEWGERKEPWLLLRAFNQTFRQGDPVRLVCKVNNSDPSVRLRAEIARLGLREDGGRISYLFNLEFPHYELAALYRAADCFLAVSRGEGWDMPLMEAMACGLPSIATDWGAHQEFVHAGISYPLRVAGTVPAVAKCPYYEGFRWAEPDDEQLRWLLRHVVEHQDEARARGARAAEEMHARWTWRHAAERILERIGAISA